MEILSSQASPPQKKHLILLLTRPSLPRLHDMSSSKEKGAWIKLESLVGRSCRQNHHTPTPIPLSLITSPFNHANLAFNSGSSAHRKSDTCNGITLTCRPSVMLPPTEPQLLQVLEPPAIAALHLGQVLCILEI